MPCRANALACKRCKGVGRRVKRALHNEPDADGAHMATACRRPSRRKSAGFAEGSYLKRENYHAIAQQNSGGPMGNRHALKKK